MDFCLHEDQELIQEEIINYNERWDLTEITFLRKYYYIECGTEIEYIEKEIIH